VASANEVIVNDSVPASNTPSEGKWTLHRQDDNGNRFVVGEHLSHAKAFRLVAEFEARGHKQMYWAEPELAQ
jgi:UDP-N-acetyl-2-amino-2-deoxyglucuronate dehydrogenase